MKTLIIAKEEEYAWMRKLFTSSHPLLTPVCNKPLVSYWVDFAVHCGSREIRIVSDGPTSELETWFGEGDRWGVNLSYASIRETDGLEEALQKNSRFRSESRLLVMQGFFFIKYDKNKDYTPFLQTIGPGDILTCETGRVIIRDRAHTIEPISASTPPSLALVSLKSMGDLYRLSMKLLTSYADHYFLPGYSDEAGLHIGHNVMLAKSARIEPPVMLGDHVQIKKGAVIGPNVVIGNHVIIDDHSCVRRSIIMDKTYVGGHLDVDKKVVCRVRIADPYEETVVDMDDPRLLSAVYKKTDNSFLNLLFHGFLAALLIMVQVVPYVLLSFILKIQGRWQREEAISFINQSGKMIRHAYISISPSGFIGTLAKCMALDRFPLLPGVVVGKLKLIGHHPLRVNERNRKKLREIQGYQAGVFSYAEGEDWPVMEADRHYSESFHASQRTPVYDFVMVAKALLNRMNMGEKL